MINGPRILILLCFLLSMSLPLAGQSKRAHKWYTNGVQLMGKRDYKAATLQFSKSIKSFKKFKEAYALRGECFYELGEIEIAIVDLEKAVMMGVVTEEPYRILISYYWSHEAYQDVMQILSYKEKVHPNDLSILEYRSRIYEEMGDYELAEASLRDLFFRIPAEDEQRRERIKAKIESLK